MCPGVKIWADPSDSLRVDSDIEKEQEAKIFCRWSEDWKDEERPESKAQA